MITIIDYGMGNLRSVEKAFAFLGHEVMVSHDPRELERARGIVLPGVGAFGDAMDELERRGLVEPLRKAIGKGLPFLGICLGYQLLFESSVELGGSDGLGLLPGKVVEIPAQGRKIPHIGWAAVTWTQPSPLTDGMRPGEPFSFERVLESQRRLSGLGIFERVSIAELASTMGIKQNYLYRVMPGLQQDGLVAKKGKGWYAKDAA